MSGAELLGAKRLREVLDRHGARLTKSLGQNFVIDPNTIRKMVDLAGVGEGDSVLEIGAGAGSLTLGLAATGAKVIALEVDEQLVPVLEETTGSLANVEVIHADVLEFDMATVTSDSLVANLPYNIAATVVLDALYGAMSLRTLTVMAQREVAERLAAPPGSKIYGRTSVLTAFHGQAKMVGTVSRNAFFPVPNVDSAIVQIHRREPPEADVDVFKRVVKAAFGQRRKTIRQSLAGVMGSPEAVSQALGEIGIDPGARPERLGLDDFVAIARSGVPAP